MKVSYRTAFIACVGLLVVFSVAPAWATVSIISAPQPVWGSKPVLSFFVDTPEIVHALRSDLQLTPAQFEVLLTAGRIEGDRLRALEQQSLPILADPSLTLGERRLQIQRSGYNREILAILTDTDRALRHQLGSLTYARLVAWIEQRWRQERESLGYRGGVGKYLAKLSASAARQYPRSFEVYATRFDVGDRYIVALPDKCLKFANGGAMLCNAGYAYGQNYSVAISYEGKIVAATVGDSGPWNVDDNFWSNTSDPQPRRMFADLGLGVPEAQAAYFNGYNGGLDQFGRQVISPVAIDISYAVAKDLGLPSGNNKVTVSFLWTEGWDGQQANEIGQEGTGQLSAPTTIPAIQWSTATPNPDGSVFHEVQQGQTLIGIANVYGVQLQDILALNGLTMNSIIQPGDKVLVKKSVSTPTGTYTPSFEPPIGTPTLSRTPIARAEVSTPQPTSPEQSQLDAATPDQVTATPLGASAPGPDALLVTMVVLVLVGAALLVWGLLLKRKE
jgi:LysM repeat protein